MLHRLAASVLVLLLSVSSALAQPLPTASPESQGVSSAGVLAFVEAFEKEVDAPHAFVLLRHGKVIAKGAWAPYSTTSGHMLYSLSKSFSATAIGILADEGKIDIDDPVISFFPEEAPKNPSDHLKAMRVRDLLSMTTGHEQDTIGRLGNENWVKAFLALNVERKPGTHFIYNSGASYMLSAIVQKVTGGTLIDYLTPRLFKPLGIENATWESDPKGINVGGWGLSVSAEDIAKLGQLYLQRGVWKEKRLLSHAWVQLATAGQTRNGTNPESDWNQGYGFQFWRCRHNAYRGDGAFGQFCLVMPDQDAVLAITAGQGDMQKTLNLVWQHLLPAFSSEKMPDDAKALTALTAKLAKLHHPIVQGEASSAMAQKIGGKTFTFEANAAKLKSVTIAFDGDKAAVTLETEQGEQKLNLVKGAWLESRVPFHKLGFSAASTTGPQPVYSSAAWTKADQLTVRAWLTATPYRLDMAFTFTEDGRGVTLASRMHPLQGKPVEIKGAVK